MSRFITFLIAGLFSINATGQTVVTKGYIDLSDFNFERNNAELNGQWEFYPYEFLSSEEVRHYAPKYIKVPSLWSKQGYPSKGFATYRLRLKINPSNQIYALHIPDVFSAYTLIVNGEIVASKGTPGKSRISAIPYRFVRTVALSHHDNGEYEIILHVSNYRHAKAGIEKPIAIGFLDSLQTAEYKRDAFNLFFAGCMLIVAVFFLGLFFFASHERVSLYLALFCVVYGYRNLGAGNYILHRFIPDLPYELLIRVEFATLYLAGIFFVSYLMELFPKDVPVKILKIFQVLSGTWIAATIVLPLDIITVINIPYILLVLIYMVIVIYIFIKAVINNRSRQWLLLTNILTIMLVFSLKIFGFLRSIDIPLYVIFSLEIIFFVSQSLILAEYFTSKWKDSSEQALEASKAKSNFLSVISHEIRTPLNIITGTIYHLYENAHKDQIEDLNNLKVSSDNLLTLVNDVLDYNKIEAGKVEIINEQISIKKVITDILESLHHKIKDKNIEILHHIDEDVPEYIMADKVRVTQVLNNLLGNAIKFTSIGHVKLTLKYMYGDKDKACLRFVISDTGIGISEDHINQIFESFSQADSTISQQFGGTGLGLAITKQLIEMMDSKLEVYSEHGYGATFKFDINVGLPKVVTHPTHESSQHKDLCEMRLLLVEDNPMNELVAKRLLKKWNAVVDIARNGKEAVDKVNNEAYDLILMDLQMPEMNGYEATREIREKGSKTPIIALTASALTGDPDKIYRAGMNGKVSKPFNPDDLFEMILKNDKRS